MNYIVFAALKDDINAGWVWVAKPDLPQRAVVRITNRKNDTTVYCEKLAIDDNFLVQYNYPQSSRIKITDPTKSIVINEWYRSKLGNLSTQSEYDLQIDLAANLYGHVRSCIDHPQIVVRLATRLGLWSIALGVIGVVIGVASMRL
jgi:hypothetical protein